MSKIPWLKMKNLWMYYAAIQCTISQCFPWGSTKPISTWYYHQLGNSMNTVTEMSSHDLMDHPLVGHQTWACLKEVWLVWLAIHSYVEHDHWSTNINPVDSMWLLILPRSWNNIFSVSGIASVPHSQQPVWFPRKRKYGYHFTISGRVGQSSV